MAWTMIKFTAKTDSGRKLVGFGLSQMNLVKIMAGEPVHVNMEEMGFPGLDFMIFGDIRKDDQELADSIKEFVNEDTVVLGSAEPEKRQ